ncbi:hypothetical protein COCCADRAFT_26599 [Bipolaris zeicola 26-R-13]|uniref:Uncharacterized protein n=1 Tax=Cochliobolus carbonum (strain 26-R-13) TaxID=930089 RepID=W6YNI2_COCC2|nr:uncharacterized protein COCCADRAFT_26599 [Bipolaris zeicola 26-R-13]EUC33021.1 hypothetical protein COCCADRAFT_26599 [Bipolaris zeicola 26-R-13]
MSGLAATRLCPSGFDGVACCRRVRRGHDTTTWRDDTTRTSLAYSRRRSGIVGPRAWRSTTSRTATARLSIAAHHPYRHAQLPPHPIIKPDLQMPSPHPGECWLIAMYRLFLLRFIGHAIKARYHHVYLTTVSCLRTS